MPAGLLPPGFDHPPPPTPGALETERQLDLAKSLDAGRRLEWVWVDVHGGFEQVGLTTFAGSDRLATPAAHTSASGGVLGVGVGARLLFFTVLARGRIGVFPLGQLYSVGLEAGMHVPLGRLEPHFELGGGYAALAHFQPDPSTGSAGLQGGYGRAGAGLDYYLVPVLSIGLDVSGELLGLSRGALGELEPCGAEAERDGAWGRALSHRCDGASLVTGV